MKISIYYLLLFAGVLAASFSQVLLKKAAGKQHKSLLRNTQSLGDLRIHAASGFYRIQYQRTQRTFFHERACD